MPEPLSVLAHCHVKSRIDMADFRRKPCVDGFLPAVVPYDGLVWYYCCCRHYIISYLFVLSVEMHYVPACLVADFTEVSYYSNTGGHS